MEKAHEIIVVVGPTAIGKTKLAIDLAQYWRCNIISADSRQFYKEMSIGTAVPDIQELSAAPHFLIQHKSIFDNYTVGDFEREALNLIEKFSKNHQRTVVVGGSGLYINALLYGLDDFPEVHKAIREELNQELVHHGIGPLQEELERVDPDYYAQVDIMNPQRVIRALEIYRSSGIPFSHLRTSSKKQRPFRFKLVGITATREEIYERINTRVDQMINLGLTHEVEALIPHKNLNALQTVGYKELFDYFENKLSLNQAIDLIKQNTRRFSKRQMTWFQKNKDIKWFERKSIMEEIVDFIESK